MTWNNLSVNLMVLNCVVNQRLSPEQRAVKATIDSLWFHTQLSTIRFTDKLYQVTTESDTTSMSLLLFKWLLSTKYLILLTDGPLAAIWFRGYLYLRENKFQHLNQWLYGHPRNLWYLTSTVRKKWLPHTSTNGHLRLWFKTLRSSNKEFTAKKSIRLHQ